MKKRKDGFLGFSLVGFLIFSATISVIAVSSILVYHVVDIHTGGNITAIFFAVLATIVVGAAACTGADVVRRKKMIEKPVRKILIATRKISSGDFSVKLVPDHEFSKYTEYDLIFENINIMTAELAKNEILKNDFISNVSHEIKTPLAVIQNYAKMLNNESLSEEKRAEYLQGLTNQTKKLSTLVSNILKLNKLENQQTLPENEEFDLAEVVRVNLITFEELMEKKNISLTCEIDEVKMVGNVSLVETVFNNLLSNAVKFTDEGGKIEVTLKDGRDGAIITVKDSGCGISKEVGEKIFDKFYQGDASHSHEGNGLGLALVKKIIDIIGGEISVASKVGQGSIFTVKLKKESHEFIKKDME